MSDAVSDLLHSLCELYAEERAEIAHGLWASLPLIKEDVYTFYDQEMVDEIADRIEHVRRNGPKRLTAAAVPLQAQALSLSQQDRGDLVHLLWQTLPSMYGIFGSDDPAFIAELDRRVADVESGKAKLIPLKKSWRG